MWVQLGHALKEAGRTHEALEAYRAASALSGSDGDAPLHAGVTAKRLGRFAEAKAALRQACHENPDNADARAELLTILHEPRAVSDQARQLAVAATDAETRRLAELSASERQSVVFDISDLISYFRHSRLPTGIQRVQMEVIRNALVTHPATQIGCFSDEFGSWVRLPPSLFDRLCEQSIGGADVLDPQWIDLIEVVSAILGNNVSVDFDEGAFLVNLGTSWWLSNYFLHVRHAQRERGIHYVPFVHDFIPVITPEHCVRRLTQDFLSWTLGVFGHADFYLVNSHSTRTDLHRVAGILGHTVPEANIAVIPLDADFRREDVVPAPVADLADWDLAPDSFVLFVSTIESRKNHQLVFRAWRELLDRYDADRVPELVCVGSHGWLNETVYRMLEEDPALAGKVRMLSHLSDGHLALLYQSCLFTVYPSLYEGWGLPVTESLCYGKVPLISNSSSLPEAGGEFATYVDAGNLDGLVAELERLSFDRDSRLAQEQRIRTGFKPRQWSNIAVQIGDEIRKFTALGADRSRSAPLPTASFGKLYRFRRNCQTRLAPGSDEGEVFRYGLGWWQLEDWGCSSRPGGGELAFSVGSSTYEVRCFLRLRGPKGMASSVTVTCGERSYRAELPQDQWRWVSLVAKANSGQVTLTIRGHDTIDLAAETFGNDQRQISTGLGGMIVVEEPEIRSLAQLVSRMAAEVPGAYAFLRDAYPMLLNRDLDNSGLQDYLLALETRGIAPTQVIEALMRMPEGLANEQAIAIFD